MDMEPLGASTAPPPFIATYRLQLRPGFGFEEASETADYLARLGVSHLYSSPYLQATPGSTHGYDVVDHHHLNRELGGAEGHALLTRALSRLGLGQVLDVVPNHMAIAGRENAWWWDVLENGPASPYAAYFDVDWEHPEAKLRDTVLLPILGDHYGRVLEAGELKLEREGGSFTIRYHEHRVPVAPPSLHRILATAAERSASDALAFIADSLKKLPLSTARDRSSIALRHRDKEVLRGLIERLTREEPRIAVAIDNVVAQVNADPDALDSLLDLQNYRLGFWRMTGSELGYRRFFDINSLVALRVENEKVLLDTHSLILSWVRDGVLQGLRIDHPDGLRDPEEYFQRLFRLVPGTWIVAEKVLEPGERLPESWPVAGTTGYDFLNRAGGLFVDPTGEGPLTAAYRDFTGEPADYAEVLHARKTQVLKDVLGGDLNRLAFLLGGICERHRRFRDFTRPELREMLREAIACSPVYRTYVRAELGQVTASDALFVERAVTSAKARRPDIDPLLFDFLRDLLLLKVRGEEESELVMRFQQLTGPAMAKGAEDTAFYSYNRLVSLNEVGGDPGRFGVSVEEFHRECAETQARWPLGLSATSTHDTKRSEDVRARIGLLSEIPARWEEAVHRWAAMNERRRREGWPDRNVEYLLYQTLVGAWPIGADRAAAYMEKASREAKVHTSWTSPRPAYDAALRSFVEGILADEEFTASLEAFVRPLVEPGRIVSLSQTLLKLTAPGVPDIYQGTEVWDLSLVDPDNRRPVDFGLRRRLLEEVEGASPEEVLAGMDRGLPKLFAIQRALALRRRRPEVFGAAGAYRPLEVSGAKAAHAVAYLRGEKAVTVVPRLVIGLGGDFGDTAIELAPGRYRNELTGDATAGGRVRLKDLLRRFPAALLSAD